MAGVNSGYLRLGLGAVGVAPWGLSTGLVVKGAADQGAFFPTYSALANACWPTVASQSGPLTCC